MPFTAIIAVGSCQFGDEELVGEPVSRLPQHVRVTAASAEVEQPLPSLLRQISREHMVIGCHHPLDATGRPPSCGSARADGLPGRGKWETVIADG